MKLILLALVSLFFLSSCALISRTLEVPGRTLQSVGRTFGF